MKPTNQPIFFEKPSDLRIWLEENHAQATELLVGFYKVGSGKPSINWPESVDEALCFGWIDGIRKSIDPESYSIRFTPRKSNSIWSAVNIKKVEELSRRGLMWPAGIAKFNQRLESRSAIYSYENNHVLSDELMEFFKACEKAWANFQAMPPSYQKTAIHWVMNAKQESTRLKRLNELISDSEAGLRIKVLRR